MKKIKQSCWKRVLLTGTTAAICMAGVSLVAKANFGSFDLEAHRGGRDVRPENTLYSFAYAMELGVTTLEMDMQLTKDSRIIISHNPIMSPNLAKGPDGNFVSAKNPLDMRTMTLADIKKYEVGIMNPNAGRSVRTRQRLWEQICAFQYRNQVLSSPRG